MLNLGQELPIATLSRHNKFQNDPVGHLGANKNSIFQELVYRLKFLPISRQPEVLWGRFEVY